MKAAIIGYGKMGREIERILTERATRGLVIDTATPANSTRNICGIDVELEFTTPATAYAPTSARASKTAQRW